MRFGALFFYGLQISIHSIDAYRILRIARFLSLFSGTAIKSIPAHVLCEIKEEIEVRNAKQKPAGGQPKIGLGGRLLPIHALLLAAPASTAAQMVSATPARDCRIADQRIGICKALKKFLDLI